MATLTVLPADSLPVRVGVEFSSGELDALTVEIEVVASTLDGSRRVRMLSDSWRTPAVGGAHVVDYAPELGVPVTYQARQFDAGGAELGLTAGDTTQVDIPTDQIIVQDPLAPRSWVQLGARASTASTLQVGRPQELYRRGDATIGLMGELGLLQGVTFEVVTSSEVEVERVRAVLAEGYFIVRSMPPVPLPRIFHGLAGQFQRVWGLTVDDDFSVWSWSADQVSSSLLPILESPLTWARYKAAYATWADAEAVYATWLDAKRNPPPEV